MPTISTVQDMAPSQEHMDLGDPEAQVTSGPHDHAGTPGLRFQRIPHAAVSWLTAAHSQADMLGVSEGTAAVFALVLVL